MSPRQTVRSRTRADLASLLAGLHSDCECCDDAHRPTDDRKPMEPRNPAAPCGAASTMIPLHVYQTLSRGCATALAWFVQTADKNSAQPETSLVPHALPCPTHGALLNLCMPRFATITCNPGLHRQAPAQRPPASRQRAPRATANCDAFRRRSPRLRQGQAHSVGGQTRVNLCIDARQSQRGKPLPRWTPDSRLT